MIPDQLSCVAEEMIKKSLSKPGVHAEDSVFIPSQKEIEIFKAQQRSKMANEKTERVKDGKVEIPTLLKEKEQDPHRLRKQVTFLPEKFEGG